MEIDKDLSCFSGTDQFQNVKKMKLDLSCCKDKDQSKIPKIPLASTSGPQVNPLEEYTFPRIEPETFAKSGKFNTVGETLEILTSSNPHKRDHMATAELCPTVKSALLTINKGNIKSLYGFDMGHNTYLYPEEALYLLEIGKLEILTEGIPMSDERCRLMFLESSQIPSCSSADYNVYKHFAKMGYRLQRRRPESPQPEHNRNTQEPQEKPMEEDVVPSAEAEVKIPRGTKRRVSATEAVDSDPNMTSKEDHRLTDEVLVEEDDSDCEFLEEVEASASKPTVRVTPLEDDAEIELDDEVTMEEAFGYGAYAYAASPLPYTVEESDSDVEFVDEVSYSIRIEEVTSDDSILSSKFSDDSGGPSTSKQSQVLVDLVSDSDSGEEADVFECGSSYQPIWAKCVPNSIIKLTFPPSEFLPENISSRISLNVYEYSLAKGSQNTDLDIDTIVDRVRKANLAGDSTTEASWKKWRNDSMAEALTVFNDSLLGKARAEQTDSSTTKNPGLSNLFQWKPLPENVSVTTLHMPYDLYPPSAAHIHRNKLGVMVKPSHRIAVVRDNELIPEAAQVPSSDDEVPVLVAVIGEGSNIIHLLCNAQPIESLF